MKKEINSKSKRKWVAGGLAAFASIALLTTGFATWVVGVNVTNKENGVNVNVDTAKNQSIVLKAALSETDKTLNLVESEKTTNKFFNVTGGGTTDLQITFSELSVVYGNDLDDSAKPTAIKFSIVKTAESEPNKVTDDKIGALGAGRTGSEWTYVDLVTEQINLTDTAVFTPDTSKTGVTAYKATSYVLHFQWGSFFNHNAPSEFYENLYTTKALGNPVNEDWNTDDKVAAKAQLAVEELSAMQAAFMGSDLENTTDDVQLTIKAELVL